MGGGLHGKDLDELILFLTILFAWWWIDRMWDTLDELVELNECDVYSYTADFDDDPMVEEGYL